MVTPGPHGCTSGQIEMPGNLTMNERLEAERELLKQLDLPEPEKFAADSEGLIRRSPPSRTPASHSCRRSDRTSALTSCGSF